MIDIKKSWLARHPTLTSVLILVFLLVLAVTLGYFHPLHFFLVFIVGLILYSLIMVFHEKWIWICSKCGRERNWQREKHCRYCGGEMTLEKEKILVKYCENGHRIEDRYNEAKACPRCGKPLK